MPSLVLWFVALATPVPPPALVRTSPPPEYSAECRLVGRDGKLGSLSVEVVNKDRRLGTVVASSPAFAAMRGKPFVTAGSGTTDWRGGWTTTDMLVFRTGGRKLSVRLTVGDHADGAKVEVVDMDDAYGVPLHAGMCRTRFR